MLPQRRLGRNRLTSLKNHELPRLPAFGASDKVAAYPADKKVAPENIAQSVYHAMGIENLEAIDREGRPFNLLPEGAVLHELY